MKQIQLLATIKSQIVTTISDLLPASVFGVGQAQIGSDIYISDGLSWKLNGIGILLSSEWQPIPSMFKLVFNGTGLVRLSIRDINGTITLDKYVYKLAETTNLVHNYITNTAICVQAIFPSTATIKLLV